jgi:hypothetical protein
MLEANHFSGIFYRTFFLIAMEFFVERYLGRSLGSIKETSHISCCSSQQTKSLSHARK